jgi:hypothetical protein
MLSILPRKSLSKLGRLWLRLEDTNSCYIKAAKSESLYIRLLDFTGGKLKRIKYLGYAL